MPQLRDRILDVVARSLEELEEHQSEVVGLKQTAEALKGILGVYRSYSFSWLRDATDRGKEHLKDVHLVAKEQDRRRKDADAARRKEEELDSRIEELDQNLRSLFSKIDALKSSTAYRDIQQIDNKRELVKTHRQQVASIETRVATAEVQLQKDTEDLCDRENDARMDLNRVNHKLDEVARIGHRHKVKGTPPRHLRLPGTDTDFAPGSTSGEVDRFETNIRSRRGEVSEVQTELDKTRELEVEMREVEKEWETCNTQTMDAHQRVHKKTAKLKDAIVAWTEQSRRWTDRSATILGDTPQWVTETENAPPISTLEAVNTEQERLANGINGSVALQRQVLSRFEQELSDTRKAEHDARVLADRWAALAEPELPRLTWQNPDGYCLADLVDFLPSLSPSEQTGLEAALEASGLLTARPEDHVVVLTNGELVAIPSKPSSQPLCRFLTIRIPTRLRDKVNTETLESILGSLSTDPSDTEAPAVVSTDGTFRVGSLRGRHSKVHTEFIGEAARQATLKRARKEANSRLAQATAEVSKARDTRDNQATTVRQLEAVQKELPAETGVVEANARLEEAQRGAEMEDARLLEQSKKREQTERVLLAAREQVRTTAGELSLPYDDESLERVQSELDSAATSLGEARRLLEALARIVDIRNSAAQRKADSERTLADAHHALVRQQEDLRNQEDYLSALEDSIGENARVINDRLRHYQDEQDTKQTELKITRDEKDQAVERRAHADARAETASDERNRLDRQGESLTHDMLKAMETPGLWEALADEPYPSDQLTSPIDLQRILATLAEYVPTYSGEHIGANSVSMSVRERRDRLGGGWDVEIRHPDDGNLPLSVEVNGPPGRKTLAQATTAVRRDHETASKVLADGQESQLRDLLQGAIAKEVAEKSHAAKELMSKMKRHIRKLSTASEIGVDIRWDMEPSLDPETKRMVELLSMLPDTRTDEDHVTLVRLLGEHLDQARAENPEVGYKQALNKALDYKNWYRLQVKVRREYQPYKVLRRRNDLSEGEKKFVTYLPLFAAVAASCDSISDASEGLGTARFVLLDDAFAKVSKDNHAQLFGLLTDLNLDWIATSERLWGDHATIPELEIVEVIRHTKLRAILLERYRWDGRSLSEPTYD